MDKYEEFINQIAEPAQRICKSYGLPASVCIAQAILESAWGESVIGNANYFGRKAVSGDKSVTVPTQECYNGEWVTIEAAFKDYDSIDDAIADWCILMLEEPCYADAVAGLPDVEQFIRLMAEKYATDPDYAEKIMQTIRANNLTQYD